MIALILIHGMPLYVMISRSHKLLLAHSVYI